LFLFGECQLIISYVYKDILFLKIFRERLKRIKTEHMDIINGKINHNVEASITNMIVNPNEEWLARKKTHYLS